MRTILRLCVAVAVLAPLPVSAISFVPLGFLSGGTNSQATAVSDDGTTVVGYAGSTSHSREEFVWRAGTGIQGLGTASAASSLASSVSGDGSVVVGTIEGVFGAQPFRWSPGDTDLDLFLDSANGDATDVSADGSVVVGTSGAGTSGGAYRWTESGGSVALPSLPGVPGGGGIAISADASVVAGLSGQRFDNSRSVFWVGTAAPTEIFGELSEAVDVSADGSVIVGQSGIRPFRWTAAGGSVPLCCFASPGDAAEAIAISADGALIVGDMTLGLSSTPHAFVWDPVHGVRLLEDALLADYGLALPGWTLTAATGVSADGQALVGYGRNPDGRQEAWFLSLPEPGTLALVVMAALVLASRRRLGRSAQSW